MIVGLKVHKIFSGWFDKSGHLSRSWFQSNKNLCR